MNTTNPTINSEAITLSAAACQHVQQWLNKQGHGVGFRIGIKTTGCSGLAYVVELVDTPNPSDKLFEQADGLKVYIDEKSWPFIKGIYVDYVRKGLNSEFTFTNPNQKSSCGCGESFGV